MTIVIELIALAVLLFSLVGSASCGEETSAVERPSFEQLRAKLGVDVRSEPFKAFIARYELKGIRKFDEGSYFPEDSAYSLLYRGHVVTRIFLRSNAASHLPTHWRSCDDLPLELAFGATREEVAKNLDIATDAHLFDTDGLRYSFSYSSKEDGVLSGISFRMISPPPIPRRVHWLQTVDEPADRPVLLFDPGKPYQLAFGRNRRWDGFESTIVSDPTGNVVVLQRRLEIIPGAYYGKNHKYYWVKSTLTPDGDARRRIADAIIKLDIEKMKAEYSAVNGCGEIWVFRVVQGDREKRICFFDYFPRPIRTFAETLDREMDRAGLGQVQWQRIPDDQARKYEEALGVDRAGRVRS